MIIEWESTEIWGANGDCIECGYNHLRITEKKRPGPVTIDENGHGQFGFLYSYEWCCSKCNATGPASNIDNS